MKQIQIRDLTLRLSGRTIIDIPELDLPLEGITALMGPNGAGKSSLLRVLAGLHTNIQGSLEGLPNACYYLPQRPYPFDYSLLDNLLLGLDNKKYRNRALEGLETFAMQDMAGQNARTLSGGELQKMALLRIFLREAELLLLDEPTAAADLASIKLMEQYILDHKNKAAIILVTHNPAQSVRLADRLVLMDEGRVLAVDTPQEIISNNTNKKIADFLQHWQI